MYRQRLIPYEIVHLKDDVILYHEPEMLISAWETLKPKAEFKYGFSCYYMYEGFKISRVYTAEKQFLYTYCDIISTDVNADAYTFLDMLVDIVIKPNGYVQVLDLDELSQACEKKLLPVTALLLTLNKADRLLKIIYAGQLPRLTAKLDECIGAYL
jgi:predicted RNA-binding protein associated with RNAse of E/G family